VTIGHAGIAQLRRLHVAVMSMGSELDLPLVLRRVVEAAVELVDARHGAVGILDHDRTVSDVVTIGEPGRLAVGDLPLTGVVFPLDHVATASFLGVPIVVGQAVYANLYLTDKRDGEAFSEVDEELVVALAAAAGIAIEKACLHARIRTMDLVEDRDRIAQDLHDTVIQRLFATGLSLHSALRYAESVPAAADRISGAIDELDLVVRALRTTVFELHVADGFEVNLARKALALDR